MAGGEIVVWTSDAEEHVLDHLEENKILVSAKDIRWVVAKLHMRWVIAELDTRSVVAELDMRWVVAGLDMRWVVAELDMSSSCFYTIYSGSTSLMPSKPAFVSPVLLTGDMGFNRGNIINLHSSHQLA